MQILVTLTIDLEKLEVDNGSGSCDFCDNKAIYIYEGDVDGQLCADCITKIPMNCQAHSMD